MPPDAWSSAGAAASATARTSSGPDAPRARAVEVDEVDPPRARLREAPRERDGLARALDHFVVVALVQPDGALAEHVHGRDHLDRLREPVS